MLQRLYARTLEIASGPHALAAMLVISFAESSFFPIPPDVLLIPMMLARPSQAWRLAALCTISSVAGGVFGYAIGYFAYETVGRPVLEFYNAMQHYDTLKVGFNEWGLWIVVIGGFTPVPYKLVTIASGVAQFDLLSFIAASIASRGGRFFLLAALLWWFGDFAREFIERRLALVTTVFAVLLVAGFVVLRYL
ncbi:MAG TPA: YqaA family protein [Stellaceae bacterium]|nr:YqaA family protein [Stellaceae bacterium]